MGRTARFRLALPDAREVAVLGLVDAEGAAPEVAALREADGQPEQGALQLRLRDLLADLGAGRLAVLARPVDRTADDLSRDVARSAEVVARAAVPRLVRLDHRIRRLDREERVVDVRPDAREQRVEEAVGAHQLDARLAGLLHLLPERLPLRRQLPRDVDELRVARDLRDQRREVRLLLAHAVTRGGDAAGLQLRLDLVGETRRVGLLVVDDVDLLQLERADDVVRDALRLRRVRRHRAEEVPGAGAVGGERRVRRRAGDEAEAAALEDGRRALDLIRAGRADDAEHAGVPTDRLGALQRLGSSVRATELRVALHQLELRLVSLVVRRDVVLRPLDLQAADRRCGPGDGSEEPDRPRLPTRQERPAGRLRRLGARTARARCRERDRGDEQSEKRLLHPNPPSWLRPY